MCFILINPVLDSEVGEIEYEEPEGDDTRWNTSSNLDLKRGGKS